MDSLEDDFNHRLVRVKSLLVGKGINLKEGAYGNELLLVDSNVMYSLSFFIVGSKYVNCLV